MHAGRSPAQRLEARLGVEYRLQEAERSSPPKTANCCFCACSGFAREAVATLLQSVNAIVMIVSVRRMLTESGFDISIGVISFA